ncbi:Ras-like guanine nucleotide exchange factor, partial [Abortiporus biennis]
MSQPPPAAGPSLPSAVRATTTPIVRARQSSATKQNHPEAHAPRVEPRSVLPPHTPAPAQSTPGASSSRNAAGEPGRVRRPSHTEASSLPFPHTPHESNPQSHHNHHNHRANSKPSPYETTTPLRVRKASRPLTNDGPQESRIEEIDTVGRKGRTKTTSVSKSTPPTNPGPVNHHNAVSMALRINCGQVLDTYGHLLDALAKKEFYKVPRFGSQLVAFILRQMKAMDQSPAAVCATSVYVTSKHTLQFTIELFRNLLSKVEVKSPTEVICNDKPISVVLETLYSQFHSFVAICQQENLYYSLAPELLQKDDDEDYILVSMIQRQSMTITWPDNAHKARGIIGLLRDALKIARPKEFKGDVDAQTPDEQSETQAQFEASLRASEMLLAAVPWKPTTNFTEEEMKTVRWKKNKVSYATIPMLVRLMTEPSEWESQGENYGSLMETFFTFFHYFTSSYDIAQLLKIRFDDYYRRRYSPEWGPADTMVCFRLIQLITVWTRYHWIHTLDGPQFPILYNIVVKAGHHHEWAIAEAAQDARAKLENITMQNIPHRFIAMKEFSERTPTKYPTTKFQVEFDLLSQITDYDTVDILIFVSKDGVEEFARALTRVEKAYFKRVLPHMFASTVNEKDPDPTIKSWDKFITAIAPWVAQCILDHTDVARRAMAIQLFIEVGHRCLKLRNFSGANNILTALQMGYITNLKETWALVTSWHIDLLSELQKFFTGSDRNTNYRNAMKEISPGIPLLYRIKGDVRKLSEFRKNQDDLPAPVFDPLTKTDEKFIDMLMFEGLRKTFHEIEHCYIPYNFPKPPNDAIDLWIRHSIRSHKGKKTEDYINKYMDLSIRREPRAPHMLKPKK